MDHPAAGCTGPDGLLEKPGTMSKRISLVSIALEETLTPEIREKIYREAAERAKETKKRTDKEREQSKEPKEQEPKS